MSRGWWGAVVVACALPAPAAQAAPTALARAAPEQELALAGDAALVSRVAGRDLSIVALGPGGERTVGVRRVPAGASPDARLTASASRIGLIVITETRRSDLASAELLSGPAAGPLAPLGPVVSSRGSGMLPVGALVDGDRLIETRIRADLGRIDHRVHEPGREPLAVTLPEDSSVDAFAGDLIAYTRRGPGQPAGDEDRVLVVAEWRTGAIRSRTPVPGGIESVDVAADGSALVGEDGGGVLEVAPGGAGVRRISRDGLRPQFAGRAAVYLRSGPREGDDRLAIAAPGAAPRPFGVRSAEIGSFAADERRVVWAANGCVLSAPLDAPAAAAPDPGPCPRSELYFDDELSQRVGRDGRVPLLLRCIAAAPPGCVGRVELRGDAGDRRLGSARFAIPAATRRRIVVRLDRRARAAVRRESRLGLGAGLEVRAVTVDPDGRRSVLTDGHAIEIR
ncbi:MAG: hypothetical protein AVDCRST_MAG30-951 [uncultured Solirubrobacteraceae bacterium]|uniref:Uncharacterized protein n=1 Tax=uncultured Solirubrobacteraceae bacterium TaxID=1162706 RepID=A0A6J4S508_9ACTN|nr:MAG: hypothetical protein AVDCRST_MAG30-951 [uncultured Solirubrobacteraceae bacterium]